MLVRVSLEPRVVELVDPDNLEQFHVERPAEMTHEILVATVADAGMGAVGPGVDLLVSVSWVRHSAAGRTGEGWDERFEGMLAYAATKGWLSADRTQIAAHVVVTPANLE